jgi:DhnA family fructose-bisphosphate aldolase class Ia
MAGLHRRISRVLGRDGRSVVLAYDHGLGGANTAGIADPGATLPRLLEAGADALLTTVGIARKFERLLSRHGLVLSLDEAIGEEEDLVREAVRLGADMGKVICYPWNPALPDSIARVRRLATMCHAWELPLMIETIPVAFDATEHHTVEKIGQAARIGCEIGADIVKMHYPGHPAGCAVVISALYVPAVVLGGTRRADDRALLKDVADAMASGASGVAIGRNVWMHEQPERMMAALAAIVHGGATADQAMAEMRVPA